MKEISGLICLWRKFISLTQTKQHKDPDGHNEETVSITQLSNLNEAESKNTEAQLNHRGSIYNCEATDLNQTLQLQKYSNNLYHYFLSFATIIAVTASKLSFSFLELPPRDGNGLSAVPLQ